MPKKLFVVVTLLIAVMMLFNSCGLLAFTSAENLIRPPKLSGIDGDLQSAFESAVSDKGDFILRYPSAGEYRSAYVRYDCDGDNEDEAFVFYSLKTEEMSVYMYMLDYSNGEWKAVGETMGDGSDIYSVEFCDLNNDGIAEILVGWSSLDSKSNKKLSVYCSYKNSQNLNYRVLVIESYTAMYTVDLDNDGETEILLALISSTSDTYTTEARLLKMSSDDKGGFLIGAAGQVSLYSEITAFTGISSCKVDNREYVYIDEAAEDSFLTEILYWDSEKNTLIAPVSVDVLTIASCPTSRSLSLTCTDVDNDGELEIPVTSLMQDSSIVRKSDKIADSAANTSLTVNNNLYLIKWCKYDGGKYTVSRQYTENTDDMFRFIYDEKEMANWRITFYPDDHTSQFFMLKKTEDPKDADESVLLFTITAVDVGDTVSIGTYLTAGTTYKYVYEITDDGEAAGITKQFIMNSFSLTDK